MNAAGVLVALVVACGLSPSPALAQTASHACVDPSDALARRQFQDEPCRWPMYELPAASATASGTTQSLPSYPQPDPDAQAGHAMFWRLPVQPRGPQDAPRHSWR